MIVRYVQQMIGDRLYIAIGYGLLLMMLLMSSPVLAQDDKFDGARTALSRLFPERSSEFTLEYCQPEDGKEVFEIDESRETGNPVIRGSSPTAVLFGVNWYLKYYCKVHLSWTGDQKALPEKLPRVVEKVRIVSEYPYRYMLNYCTFNYSMSFWDWPRWERELDFLALNGVNLVLAPIGQEKVWQNFLRRMELSEDEIRKFIPGPAYQAWWLMGNLEGTGGPVSQAWIDRQYRLQKQILSRMNDLGMEPILQGFTGIFPRSSVKSFPGAVKHTGRWCGFARPAMIDPTNPLFPKAASLWYEEQSKLYGSYHFYGGDPFHEGGSVPGLNLMTAAKRMEEAMQNAHKGSKWVLQAWGGNPKPQLLKGISRDKAMIIDLCGESVQTWKKKQGWDGTPWIWAIIQNYGGRPTLFGALNKIASVPPEILQSPYRKNLQGIGGIMEAIGQNSPTWDLLFEMAWRSHSPDINEWISEYARRRYGKITPNVLKAWKILADTAYHVKSGERDASQASIFCQRPNLFFDRKYGVSRRWGKIERHYDFGDLLGALKLMVNDAEEYRGIDTFEYDLINLSRQVITDYSIFVHKAFVKSWMKNDLKRCELLSAHFLELLRAQDDLMATDKRCMVGPWIASARSLGSTPEEKDLFERNARMLITSWADSKRLANELHDYANREWSGLLGTLYYDRWNAFYQALIQNPRKDSGSKKPSIDPSKIDWYEMEKAWIESKDTLPLKPKGDRIVKASEIFETYSSRMQEMLKNPM